MERDYWEKQISGQPLYPDMLWSRPENRTHAGKLLIVGGNAHGFVAPAEAYRAASAAGIGTARMLLPDSLQKLLGRSFEAGEYAPTTPSGSFSQRALGELLPMAHWADGVLLAGDLGRNSETAILLEKLTASYVGQLTVTQDAADYFTSSPEAILTRENTLLVISLAQLQKLAMKARFTTAFTFDMNFLQLIEALHEFSTRHRLHIIVRHLDNIFVAVGGRVSSTHIGEPMPTWRVQTAASAAVWWLQNPGISFEAMTTSLLTQDDKTSTM